jgi:hypothetical protein
VNDAAEFRSGTDGVLHRTALDVNLLARNRDRLRDALGLYVLGHAHLAGLRPFIPQVTIAIGSKEVMWRCRFSEGGRISD